MNELKGKVAIVTGTSTPSGIGNAIAKRFAKAGASVLCVAEATRSNWILSCASAAQLKIQAASNPR